MKILKTLGVGRKRGEMKTEEAVKWFKEQIQRNGGYPDQMECNCGCGRVFTFVQELPNGFGVYRDFSDMLIVLRPCGRWVLKNDPIDFCDSCGDESGGHC